MKKVFKPSNFYLFFENKIINIIFLVIPFVMIYINSLYYSNYIIRKIIFYSTLISLLVIIKPVISFIKKRKEKYIIKNNALEIHHPVLIGDKIESYVFGKMTIELDNKIITHSIKIDDFTSEDNESILWISGKKECLELYNLLQENNSLK